MNPLRLAAATLITALTVGTLFGGVAAATPAPAQAESAAAQVVKTKPTVVVQRGPATFHVGAASYTYVVERLDTLSKISGDWLGSPNRWREICDLNWHRHFPQAGGTLRDCDLIYPGWDLKLPADAKPPSGAAPAPPPAAQPEPDPVPGGAGQPTPAPTASTPPSQDPDGVVEPSATNPPGASGNPGTTTTASDEDGTAPAPSTDDDGVNLPGGSFVPWALAAAITAAAAMVWLQRRRRFVPGDGEHDDPPELPAPVVELHRQIARNRE